MLIVYFFHHDAEIRDKLIKSNEDFVWAIEVPLTGKFIIDVEFLDLKTACPNVRIHYLHISLPLVAFVVMIIILR